MSCSRVSFTFIFCGIRPYFVVLIEFASGVVNVRIALASMSWNPRPPNPDGVVDICHAWWGRGVVSVSALVEIIVLMKCLVISLIVLVNWVLYCLYSLVVLWLCRMSVGSRCVT